jgi:cytidylate kinase
MAGRSYCAIHCVKSSARSNESELSRKLIIAIDGPVGSGKSSVARRVAQLLGYTYLDSGAMYRAIAWKAVRDSVPLNKPDRLEALARSTRIDLTQESGSLRGLVDGLDATEQLRFGAVSQAASQVAVVGGVRAVLVGEQQRAGAAGGVVMEGRDIGTVVFPHAELKIFLEASVEVRAQRRYREHLAKGDDCTFEQVLEEIHERDKRDRERTVSPLIRAKDAVLVDNTAMNVEATARLIALLAREQDARAVGSAETAETNR